MTHWDMTLPLFHMPMICSNLNLYKGSIDAGTQLKCISFRQETNGYALCKCNAIAGEIKEGNYFSILTEINLKEGCSGSPVLLGNNVVGVLTKDNNND